MARGAGRTLFLGLMGVTALRLLVAAVMPLSADEAYYRVWAHALAPGYLDHPPMVALWMRAGIALAGDTPLGVRLFGPLSALAGSFLLWRAGEDLAPGTGAGRRAVWMLNATLLLNAGAVIMTPDTPLLLFWTAALAALARLAATGNGAWFLAAGAAAGLGFDSKYTAALLAPCVAVWLLIVPSLRPWLLRWQAWAGAALAIALTSPVLAWNATHGWVSLMKQGGRTGDWAPARAAGFVGEFLAGQAGLATPILFALFLLGLARCLRGGRWRRSAVSLAAVFGGLPLVVFLQHALGGRVQANWPSIAYPALALAAAFYVPRFWRAGTALGLGLSALVYFQATTGALALPRRLDFSLIRLAGWPDLARAADVARGAAGADCLAADEYGLAAELATNVTTPVLGVEPRWALFALPPAPASCRTVLLVRSARESGQPDRRIWPSAIQAGSATRGRAGIAAETYLFYRAATPAAAVLLPPPG